MNSKGIASGGNLIVDYVKIVDSYPVPGNLSTIFETSRSIGGAVTNVLVDLAKMDNKLPLQAIGYVGNDENGEYILQCLNSHRIDSGLVYRHTLLGTSYTDVISVKSTGDRTFFHYRGSNRDLGFEHFDFKKIDADIIHIGYALLLDVMDGEDSEYGTVMAKTLAFAQKNGLKTSLDVVSENSDRFSRIVPPSIRYTDYCTINEVESSMITGIKARKDNGRISVENIKEMCRRLFEMGAGKWVVIHAPEAGFGMDKNGKFHVQPSVDVPKEFIKGKAGAGDAFCSGILYSAFKDWDIDKALMTASAVAACSLSEANTTDGMKTVEEAWDIFNKYPKTDLDL